MEESGTTRNLIRHRIWEAREVVRWNKLKCKAFLLVESKNDLVIVVETSMAKPRL